MGDGNGTLNPWEVCAVHGGDSDGLFTLMDTDGDGVVTLHEFVEYFMCIKERYGGAVVGVIVAYLELNSERHLEGGVLITLPLASLLLGSWETSIPVSVQDPQAELTSDQCNRAVDLFTTVVIDGDGALDCDEILNFYGAGVHRILNKLEKDSKTRVTIVDWLQFFSLFVQERGVDAVEYTIHSLERIATTLRLAKSMVE